MSGWKAKRFWTDAIAVAGGEGWQVHLDGRTLRTPAKAPLVVPTRALAEALAAEWQAQGETVLPETMPLTRAANSAIDKVTPQQAEVVDMLAAYAETDLLCHRAGAPADLARRQAEAWDPLLDWAATTFDAPLVPVTGIIASRQPPESLARLRAEVAALDPFRLTAFHDLVALSGSLVLALAALGRLRPPEALWAASRIDEDWQERLWGRDEEAAETAEIRRRAFLQAVVLLDLLDSTD